MFSRFSSNSEASELLENLEDMFPRDYMQVILIALTYYTTKCVNATERVLKMVEC